MGLTSAVHWWEESQMRVLVLSSLFVQFLLLIFSFMRRFSIPGWIRSIMWLAYLAGDSLAIYALATLFNRHKDQDHGRSSLLEVVWAPILLIHLGGHDGITAYNIEDNELWSRHLLTAASQVTVAIYVFWKSWPAGGGDRRLLQTAILLFVPGVLKCLAKPWALKSASINSLVSSPSSAVRTAKQNEDEMRPLEDYVEQAIKAYVEEAQQGARASNRDHPPSQQRARQNEGTMDSVEKYVEAAMTFVQEVAGEAHGQRAPVQDGDHPPPSSMSFVDRKLKRERAMILHRESYNLFVDLSSPYQRRLSIFKYFWVLSEEKTSDRVYGSVREGLANAFLLLYTKLKTAGFLTETDLESKDDTRMFSLLCRQWIMVSRTVLPWAAIGLFHKSHREAYNDIDVKITYAMLCCTALEEAYSYIPIMFAGMAGSDEDESMSLLGKEQWPEKVAQYSLMGYFSRNRRHNWIRWTLRRFGCKEFVDQRWCMSPSTKSSKITGLVLQYLKAGWVQKIQNAASYRRFNDNRGHCALEDYQRLGLGWSIKRPFDESVLLWHIATYFCFFSRSVSEHKLCAFDDISIWSELALAWKEDTDLDQGTRPECGDQLPACKAVICRQMSNYMVYLLFVNPEMLLPGTRRNLFTAAYEDLKKILESQRKPAPVKEKEIMKKLINTMKRKTGEASEDESNKGSEEGSKGGSKASWINEAWTGSQGSFKLKKASKEEGSEEEIKEGSTGSFIDDAWILAKGLLELKDDEMWKVIMGVWVEMLCFSASRCRGYLHAKALSSGGEFLSYVWLLMSYMGMETFTDRLWREREREEEEELPSRQDENNNADPSASDACNVTASSTPKIHNYATPSTPEIHIDMF